MKKKWKFGLKVADSHSEPGNLQKLEDFFLIFFHHVFIIFFSFSLPVAPEIQESHENQWKTMENHQKQRKMKKKWSCKWKKNEVANEKKNEVANEKKWSLMAKGDEQKWKKMKIKWKKNDDENDNENENENGNGNENEKKWKNNNFWWSQTVAVRIL